MAKRYKVSDILEMWDEIPDDGQNTGDEHHLLVMMMLLRVSTFNGLMLMSRHLVMVMVMLLMMRTLN